jgi:hypothetical protein
MNKSIFQTLLIALIIFSSCNQAGTQNGHENHEMTSDSSDASEQKMAAPAEQQVKTVAVRYPDLDAGAGAVIGDIVDHYLHIKNALVNDNAAEAASGGKSLTAAMAKLDKSLLTAEQKTAYDAIAAGLKDHAGQIAGKGADIERQRESFVFLSEEVYALAKAFGGGRTLYHDHCPMARDNQGAMWISESKDVKNPYFGAGMLTCGSVEEVIQ